MSVMVQVVIQSKVESHQVIRSVVVANPPPLCGSPPLSGRTVLLVDEVIIQKSAPKSMIQSPANMRMIFAFFGVIINKMY